MRLQESGDIRLLRVSSAYETEPVGEGFKGWFINAVAEAETDLDPLSLFKKLKRIEEEMGRSGQAISPNRPIDLDLLLYGDLLLETEALSIPHPRLHQRRFALEPLSELAPELVHPRRGKTMAALLEELSDPHQARRVREVLQGSF